MSSEIFLTEKMRVLKVLGRNLCFKVVNPDLHQIFVCILTSLALKIVHSLMGISGLFKKHIEQNKKKQTNISPSVVLTVPLRNCLCTILSPLTQVLSAAQAKKPKAGRGALGPGMAPSLRPPATCDESVASKTHAKEMGLLHMCGALRTI